MTRLHVHEWGDPAAPPLVCLHGVLAHGLRFRRLAEERLATRFRVVAPDLRGHGRSDWEPPWTLEACVDDVLETLGALGIERADWIGHSFGGRLILELARRAPERVVRAVLLDPAVWVPPPIALRRAEEERLDKTFADPEDAVAARQATAPLAPRELLEEEVEQHLEPDGDGRWRWRYAQSAAVAIYGELAQPSAPLAEFRFPTLVVRGAASEVVPDVLVEVYREAVGDLLEVVTVPGGHIVLWDAYAETADAVDAFLV